MESSIGLEGSEELAFKQRRSAGVSYENIWVNSILIKGNKSKAQKLE